MRIIAGDLVQFYGGVMLQLFSGPIYRAYFDLKYPLDINQTYSEFKKKKKETHGRPELLAKLSYETTIGETVAVFNPENPIYRENRIPAIISSSQHTNCLPESVWPAAFLAVSIFAVYFWALSTGDSVFGSS